MKNKLYQPMDPKDAINYIYDNQYDSPRSLNCVITYKAPAFPER